MIAFKLGIFGVLITQGLFEIYVAVGLYDRSSSVGLHLPHVKVKLAASDVRNADCVAYRQACELPESHLKQSARIGHFEEVACLCAKLDEGSFAQRSVLHCHQTTFLHLCIDKLGE